MEKQKKIVGIITILGDGTAEIIEGEALERYASRLNGVLDIARNHSWTDPAKGKGWIKWRPVKIEIKS